DLLGGTILRATSTSSPTNGFSKDGSFNLSSPNTTTFGDSEEPNILKINDNLFFIITDSLNVKTGMQWWWTTNLLGSASFFNFMGSLPMFATNWWDNYDTGSGGWCMMTNGLMLMVYDGTPSTNNNIYVYKRIGAHVLNVASTFQTYVSQQQSVSVQNPSVFSN